MGRTARLAGIAAGYLLLGAGAAQALPPACRDLPGRTVFEDATLRVYTTSTAVRGDPDAHTLRVFACAPAKRVTHRLELLRNNLDGAQTPVAVTRGGSRWIVVDYDEETGTDSARDLWEYDLTTFRRVARTSVDGIDDPGVVATKDGGFAFFDGLALAAVDARSRRVLEPAASQLTAGATAVAAGGDTVYWQAAGAVKAATLTGHPSGDVA